MHLKQKKLKQLKLLSVVAFVATKKLRLKKAQNN
jgi:hypothetical protein